jgi:hypothetical protein
MGLFFIKNKTALRMPSPKGVAAEAQFPRKVLDPDA